MAWIGEGELARIKAEVSLARLVEGCGVELWVQGQDLVGRCPFRDDAGSSLVVSPGKNLWHCLGACRAGGPVVDWVVRAQGVSFRHVVELLCIDAEALRVLAVASPLREGAGLMWRPGTRSSRGRGWRFLLGWGRWLVLLVAGWGVWLRRWGPGWLGRRLVVLWLGLGPGWRLRRWGVVRR